MLRPDIVAPKSIVGTYSLHTDNARLRAVGWGVAAVIAAEYIAYFFSLRSYPLQDYPNHLARGVVICDVLFNHGLHSSHTASPAGRVSPGSVSGNRSSGFWI